MSYCSAQDPRVFFGLGAHEKVDTLIVRWPSGYVQEMKDVPADTVVQVTEGVGAKALKYPAPRSR
jgi:enediyne biosynthesis protein E4